jgi:type VI secretion system protein ImpA
MLMAQALEDKAGSAAPPTGRVRDVLNAIAAVANLYAPPDADISGANAIAPEGTVDQIDIKPAGETMTGGALRPATREDMLRELERIADFFRRTEPHSPLAYTLEEAVRRGRLTWPELLSEVVPDDKARGAMLMMLGIRPAPPG